MNVAFTIEFEDVPMEGWAQISISYDLDNEPQWVDVEAIERDTSTERDRQIQSGAAIEDNIPHTKHGDQIVAKVIEWCNGDGWEWCMDAAKRTGSIPEPHPNDWMFGSGYV